MSFGFRPATSAGDFARLLPVQGFVLLSALALAGTQPAIEASTLLFAACPMPMARTKNRNRASTKCMNEPAASTMMRCQPG